MKITKLSLAAVAAMTLTTGAMAEVTADFSGNVKIWYETADADGGVDNSLFHQNSTNGFTAGDAAASLEVKGKAGVLGYGLKYTMVDTLGLENNLVSTRRQPANGTTLAQQLRTAHWAEKAFITYKMGNTTAKIGRQHLNTPLAFTEAWNVSANSFDAAVLMNSDIENVTLVGAYVGKGNGGNAGNVSGFSTVAPGGEFTSYYGGAYAAGVLAKPTEGLGVNAWYYNVQDVADAVWTDANFAISGVKLGAVYAQMMPKAAGADDTKAFAVQAGTKAGPVSLFAAYSDISDEGTLHMGNTATGFKKTKLPTAGVYNDGVIVAAPGAKTFKVKAAMPVGSFKLAAQYISTTNDYDVANATFVNPTTGVVGLATGREVDEFDLIASTKIADVNVKAIFINRTFNTNQENGSAVKSDANHVRIIAGINF